MKVLVFWLILFSGLTFADVRQEALVLVSQAAELFEEAPLESSQLAEEAYRLLGSSQSPEGRELASCAGLAARAARDGGDFGRAEIWFEHALKHADGEGVTILRAEFSDLLMRSGRLMQARGALGKIPNVEGSKSVAKAQLFQAAAKLEMACGRPEIASDLIRSAIHVR